MNSFKFFGALAILISSALAFSMEYPQLTSSSSDYVAIDMPNDYPDRQVCFDYCQTQESNHKKVFMAAGSALAALGTNIVFGAANAPAATIFLGTFGTSVKGILPKSKDRQALKIASAIGAMGAGAAIDYGLSQAGFNTHWVFFNLGLVGGMSTIKRVQKGHIKEKSEKKKSKQQPLEEIVIA